MAYDYNKIKPFLSEGSIVENAFANDLIKECGGSVRKSSLSENKYSHIDLFYQSEKEGIRECSMDVKGARKVHRTDDDVSYDETWLEFKNGEGNKGSLCGDEDYLVFEGKHEWYIVNRISLLENTKKTITDENLYHHNPQECFKLYQRYGRKDIITRVPISFIEQNTCKRIPKSI